MLFHAACSSNPDCLFGMEFSEMPCNIGWGCLGQRARYSPNAKAKLCVACGPLLHVEVKSKILAPQSPQIGNPPVRAREIWCGRGEVLHYVVPHTSPDIGTRALPSKFPVCMHHHHVCGSPGRDARGVGCQNIYIDDSTPMSISLLLPDSCLTVSFSRISCWTHPPSSWRAYLNTTLRESMRRGHF